MAPNKFEKHIKEKLDDREINPSVEAWQKLSDQLDVSEEPKKGEYFWYGIAASFIGLLIVSILYFNSNNSVNIPDVQVVDAADETIEKVIPTEPIIETDSKFEVIKNDKIKLPVVEVKPIHSNQASKLKNQITSVEEIEPIADKVMALEDFKDQIINTKILEIIAQVDSLEQGNITLTDAEVDVLLRDAQMEILNAKLFSQNGSVDAMALLTEVEDELDTSFRNQIFDSLKDGFQKVRMAVANRNN